MHELERPLITYDLETTHTSTQLARIVQIAVIKSHPRADGTIEDKEWTTLVNPGIHIPEEATEVHGITDEMVQDAPPFSDFAPALASGFSNGDFAGFNHKAYDNAVLINEFKRVGIDFTFGEKFMVDGFRIYTKLKPRNLTNFIKDVLGEEHEGAHGALADARGTLRALRGLYALYPNLPRTPKELHYFVFGDPANVLADGKFAFNDRGDCVIKFGKHSNSPLSKVPRSYLGWVLQADFPEDVKLIVRDALSGKFPTKPAGAASAEPEPEDM